MAIVYRLEKGAPLTVEEVDGNFKELHQRLMALEKNSGSTEGWGGQVVLEGTNLVFLSPTKEILNQISLPLPHFCPRGRWEPQKSYAVYDLVAVGPQAYCCIKTHQSSEQFMEDHGCWKVVVDVSDCTQIKKLD